MNGIERVLSYDDGSDFGMEFDIDGFDINAAFQEAITDVASDAELALDEKVRRMEVIVSEGASDLYRDFVDFSAMAAQMAMMCAHDHAFGQLAQTSETLSGLMAAYTKDDGHHHSSAPGAPHSNAQRKADFRTGNKNNHKTHAKKTDRKAQRLGVSAYLAPRLTTWYSCSCPGALVATRIIF